MLGIGSFIWSIRMIIILSILGIILLFAISIFEKYFFEILLIGGKKTYFFILKVAAGRSIRRRKNKKISRFAFWIEGRLEKDHSRYFNFKEWIDKRSEKKFDKKKILIIFLVSIFLYLWSITNVWKSETVNNIYEAFEGKVFSAMKINEKRLQEKFTIHISLFGGIEKKEQEKKCFRVKKDNINIRSTYSIDKDKIIDTVSKGTILEDLKVSRYADENTWRKVKYKGIECWIVQSVLEEID